MTNPHPTKEAATETATETATVAATGAATAAAAKRIVITGSTRGIGLGLAAAFLARGCRVLISGRSEAGVRAALEQLDPHPDTRLRGHPCDVRHAEQVAALWDAGVQAFGGVDIWIDNAGLSIPRPAFWQHPPEEIEAVIGTNLLGAMHGARVAIGGMLAQGGGSYYAMEGLGSDGRHVPGLTLYGSSKYALRYLVDGLIAETRNSPVRVGALSPGMVVTDLLVGAYDRNSAEWKRAKRLFEILADRVETVTPWLAERVLANDRHGARIVWLTRGKALRRFLLAPLTRRKLFDEEPA